MNPDALKGLSYQLQLNELGVTNTMLDTLLTDSSLAVGSADANASDKFFATLAKPDARLALERVVSFTDKAELGFAALTECPESSAVRISLANTLAAVQPPTSEATYEQLDKALTQAFQLNARAVADLDHLITLVTDNAFEVFQDPDAPELLTEAQIEATKALVLTSQILNPPDTTQPVNVALYERALDDATKSLQRFVHTVERLVSGRPKNRDDQPRIQITSAHPFFTALKKFFTHSKARTRAASRSRSDDNDNDDDDTEVVGLANRTLKISPAAFLLRSSMFYVIVTLFLVVAGGWSMFHRAHQTQRALRAEWSGQPIFRVTEFPVYHRAPGESFVGPEFGERHMSGFLGVTAVPGLPLTRVSYFESTYRAALIQFINNTDPTSIQGRFFRWQFGDDSDALFPAEVPIDYEENLNELKNSIRMALLYVLGTIVVGGVLSTEWGRRAARAAAGLAATSIAGALALPRIGDGREATAEEVLARTRPGEVGFSQQQKRYLLRPRT